MAVRGRWRLSAAKPHPNLAYLAERALPDTKKMSARRQLERLGGNGG
jgi:hypothetical protein